MPLRRVPCVVTACALLAVGCGISGGGGSDASPGTSTASATSAATEVLSAKDALGKVRGSMALLETPIGSGSAVLVDDGYLVTNAHVVDPFDVVDVTFEDEEPELDVPVVAVDLDADLAVVGPIDTDHDAVAIEDPAGVEPGSDVYLVGFPGDQDEPQVTITGGILSRRREAKAWGLEFLQSDNTIAPGQSGGALLDDRGRVIGISGLADDDGNALTFDGGQAAEVVADLLDDEGSDWDPAPREADDREASFQLEGTSDYRILYFPAEEQDRTLTIGAEGTEPVVELDDVGAYPLAVNEAARDMGTITGVESSEDLPTATEPDPDGRWTFALEAGLPTMLFVGTAVDEATPMAVTSTEPFAVVADDPEAAALDPGDDPVEGTLGYFDTTKVFTLDLTEGDEVDILASSASGDVAYTVVAPGDTLDESEEVDDGGGGLFGQDAGDTYTADADGPHRLYVYQVEGVSTGFRLTVT